MQIGVVPRWCVLPQGSLHPPNIQHVQVDVEHSIQGVRPSGLTRLVTQLCWWLRCLSQQQCRGTCRHVNGSLPLRVRCCWRFLARQHAMFPGRRTSETATAMTSVPKGTTALRTFVRCLVLCRSRAYVVFVCPAVETSGCERFIQVVGCCASSLSSWSFVSPNQSQV